MKKHLIFFTLFLFLFASFNLYSLSNFNYTGIAFDGSGSIITSAPNDVTVVIEIIDNGTLVYKETHSSIATTQFGVYSVEVGAGTIDPAFSAQTFAGLSASKTMRIKSTTSQGNGSAGVWVVSSILKPSLAITGGRSGLFWKTKGNSGIDEATNFIGTTDDKDVIFKRNDTEVMRIDDDGWLGMGTATPNALLDISDPTATGKTFSRTIKSAYDQSYFKMAITSEFSVHGQGQTNNLDDMFYSGYFDVEIADDNTDAITRVVGAQGQISNFGEGTISQARGTAGFIGNDGDATITNAYAGYFGIYQGFWSSQPIQAKIHNAYVIAARNGANANGATTDNKAGVTIENMTGATNNTDLLMGTMTIPTGNYAIYSASSYPSYFADKVGIGTDAPDSRLFVFDDAWTDNISSPSREHPYSKSIRLGFDDNVGGGWEFAYGIHSQISISDVPHSVQYFNSGMFDIQTDASYTGDLPNWTPVLQGQFDHFGTGHLTKAIRGIAGLIVNRSTGTMDKVYGGYVGVANMGGGHIGRALGLYVRNYASGTFDEKAGIVVEEQTNATNNTDILLGTATIPTGNYAIYSASTYPSYFAGPVNFAGGIGDLVFEGATADAFETTLTVADPTTDNTVTLPDADGTVMLTSDSWTSAYTTDNRNNYIPVWDASGEGAFVKSNIQMGVNGHFFNFMDSGLPGAGSTPRVEIGAGQGNGGGAADPNGSATGFVKINGRGTYGSTGYAIAGMNSSNQDDKGSVWIADAALGDLTATNITPLRGIMGYDPTTTAWSIGVGDFDNTIPSLNVSMYWQSNTNYGLNVGTVTNINQNGDITTAGNISTTGGNLTVAGNITTAGTVTVNNTSGRAISVTDGGGDVKLSYGSGTVSSNAITVPNNVSVYYITSDDDGTADAVTLPTGTNGEILYVVIYDPYAGGTPAYDDIQVVSPSITITRTAQTISCTLVYANGAWQLCGIQQY
jgi:hypothetical protein